MASKKNEKALTRPLQVLYEDNHLIAVNKPPGVLVQGDASGAFSLMDMIKEYIKNKHRKPGNVFLGLVHRLDRPVSGVVLFARTSKAASRISEQLRSRSVEKTYLALVHGTPSRAVGDVKSYLKMGENKVTTAKEGEKAVKEAVLSYRTLRSLGEMTLLEIRLHTGRKHQIRVQLSAIGHPIEGDVKYGAPWSLEQGSIRLAAKSLTFRHPTRKEQITIEAPAPEWAATSTE